MRAPVIIGDAAAAVALLRSDDGEVVRCGWCERCASWWYGTFACVRLRDDAAFGSGSRRSARSLPHSTTIIITVCAMLSISKRRRHAMIMVVVVRDHCQQRGPRIPRTHKRTQEAPAKERVSSRDRCTDIQQYHTHNVASSLLPAAAYTHTHTLTHTRTKDEYAALLAHVTYDDDDEPVTRMRAANFARVHSRECRANVYHLNIYLVPEEHDDARARMHKLCMRNASQCEHATLVIHMRVSARARLILSGLTRC